MDATNYQELLSSLTNIISPFDTIDDITKTKLNIDNRTVNIPTVTVFKDAVVEGDANSKTIAFTIARYYDGIDRSDKIIVIKYINAKNQGDWFKVEDIIIDEEYIQFVWLLDERIAIKEGSINYIIEFSGFRDEKQTIPYYWHTNPSYFTVNKGLDVDDHIISAFPSVLENHEIRLRKLEDSLGIIPDNIVVKLSGVYVGEDAPEDEDKLWIIPESEVAP